MNLREIKNNIPILNSHFPIISQFSIDKWEVVIKLINPKSEVRNPKQTRNSKLETRNMPSFVFLISALFQISGFRFLVLKGDA